MNNFLEWLDDWYLGIEEIDRQHLQLAYLFNQVATALEASSNSQLSHAVVLPLVYRLQEETRQHFKDEEEIMREHDYPWLTEHHREHVMLLAELQEFIREIEEGTRQFDYASLTALKHWLINHVIESDLAFARHLER